MRFLCFVLSVFVLFSPLAAAQSDAPKAPAPPKSEAQLSFDTLKSLAGEWEGPVTIDPPMNGVSMAAVRVVLRVTSRGNAVVHELQENTGPFWMRSSEQSAKADHPVTMLYLDGEQLAAVHYCDAGNRPRFSGKTSADGKGIAFDYVDISGPMNRGHMHAMEFTPVDANRHTEHWTFMLPGGKAMHARFDLRRVN